MDQRPALDSFCEVDLLTRVARKDAEAFGSFYDRTSPVLYSIANSILRDEALAEDVLQDVYLMIWEKAELFDPALGKPIAWAIALTRNKALDRLRSRKRLEVKMRELAEFPASEMETSKTASSDVELLDAAAIVRGKLEALPAKQRRAIELSLLHGLVHAEIADAMQEPLGTVKAWIRRGIIEIRAQLEDCL
jgi:RNA polymerase sigma-70 factor (ECF subfamily)